ncbi:Na+/H+ antiporter NhaA [Bifidobacterium avesanii]|uniref:Na(+)/H(+) antiporter NhaA n=1 Tax=Bifidobacterium avesanii TaxID=1798157 RepID=A0A7K3TH74_9BIFI|nr:Na+/H+ antiporter NhaA [Bifidobacterium avesanii]KAB8292844.1 Na+/H+ antiporter [Bifidobacterium avesanii]NEG78448.1 sodium:proton antiporter [Bifidobacterium avesanii]
MSGKGNRRNRRGGFWTAVRHIAASDRISGLIMLGFAFLGLVLANLPVTADLFGHIAETHVGIPHTNIDLPIGHWAQDGLLTAFFLVVGLDLKQELTTGSLANPKAAAVPMLCAVGGMLVPPVLFLGVTWLYSEYAPPGPGFQTIASGQVFDYATIAQGWAVPTATDIAFSLAVLALFAKALPGSIRAFLMTLATVDDLLAIILIAVFFSSLNAWYWFIGIALAAAAWAWLVRRRRVPWLLAAVVGLLAWVMMFEAGVHPTLAGVLVGLLTPSREMFGEKSPRAHRYHHKLQPLSALVALPIFALFATGVRFSELTPALMVSPVVVGITAALVVGKPTGVMLTAWLTTRVFGLKLAKGLAVRDLFPAACACGIGFTVSFLIASLAYADTELSAESRFGVLVASLLAAAVSGVLLHAQSRRYEAAAAAGPKAAHAPAAVAPQEREGQLDDGTVTMSMPAFTPETLERFRERFHEDRSKRQ